MKLMMKLLYVSLLLLISVPMFAQEEDSRVDIFGGFNLLSAKAEGETTGGDGFSTWTTLKGWHSSASFNLSKSFALEAEASAVYESPLANYLIMGGPKYTFSTNKVTPFAHFLAGISHTSIDFPGLTITDNNNLTLAMGGGLDFKVAPWVSIRPVQLDYITAAVEEPVSGNTNWTQNVRYSFGAVFHLK